jgi:chromosome segregation protein
MHLKRLEAFGFKSFADRVVFNFERGVSAIVGPNGCGKSNIVDAVKWVLGEQSAKSLRSSEMLDVLFNGSEYRKPLNFAEVTLTFDNQAGLLPLAAPEVSVTRRLYRSGDSEYLINKAICRLRDIRELFWDTGIGTSSYSIIEQGRIAQFIESNAKDRRSLFEEAAGIHKYKERKKVALRKLDRVEINVARVNDVKIEVEKRLRSVIRQAAKARQVKELQDKLRSIGISVLLNETATTENDLQKYVAELEDAQKAYAALASELVESQAITAREQEAMNSLDLRLGESSELLSASRAFLQRLEAELESARRTVEESGVEAEKAEESAQKSGEQAALLAAERERLELDVSRIQDVLKTLAENVGLKESALRDAERNREKYVAAVAQARHESLQRMGVLGRLRETLSRSEAELSAMDFRFQSVQAQLNKAEDGLRAVESEANELQTQLEALERKRVVLTEERDALKVRARKAEDEFSQLTEKALAIRAEHERRRSRLAVLEDLRAGGEGLSPGVRAVVTTLREERELFADVHGLVADCLGVDPRLESAVEAALGAHIETVVVGSPTTAAELCARLHERALGRAVFLPLSYADERATATREARLRAIEPFRNKAGFLGVLTDWVTSADQYRTVAESLLGDALLFADRAAAEAVRAEAAAAGLRCATPAGELFAPDGAVGGGRERPQRLSLLARKNEMVRLREEMGDLALQGEALSEQAGAAEKETRRCEADIEKLDVEIQALSLATTELKTRRAVVERDKNRGHQEKEEADEEARRLEVERRSSAERTARLRVETDEATKAERETTERVPLLEAEFAQAEQTATAAREAHTAALRDSATHAERATAMERECRALSARFAERRDEADREARRAEALRLRGEEAKKIILEKDALQRTETASAEQMTAEVAELKEEKEARRALWEDARSREREVSGALNRAQEQLGEIRVREAEARQRLEHLLERGRKEFETDLRAELQERGGPPPLTAEEREQAAIVEEKIRKLGPVNLYALEEQKELEERANFLAEQAGDLAAARDSLRDVIARINRRSRKLFQETFDKVRENFHEIFRKLFGGGRADLLLEEGEDILEAGIEIVARPPGKELRSITLLSGGEKAMTTIALLFAVFRSRPAPFCVLDEVDAPLDEANVDRFNAIVREFMDRSQFVIITHNKRTMAHADVMYGITMPEPGVSKRIAVKFDELEKQIPDLDDEKKPSKPTRASAPNKVEADAVEASVTGGQ